MKTAVLHLNAGNMEADFFENSRLIGIQCTLPGYSLCSQINKRIDTHFVRDITNDVCLDYPKLKAKSASFNLFEAITDTAAKKIHYPVYRHTDVLNDEIFMLLYTNKIDGHPLLTDARWADYLLLLKCESYDEVLNNITTYLQKITVVDWLQELQISSLKTKKYLII